MAASAMAGATTSTMASDITVTPFAEILSYVQQHNKKTKEKAEELNALQRRKNCGEKLTAAQTVDLSLMQEHEKFIRHDEEIIKLILAQQKEYEAAMKEKKCTKKTEEQEPELTKDSCIEALQSIRRFLHAKELLAHIDRPIVRRSFEEGEFGAPKLSEENFVMIDDLQKLFNTTSEGCRDNTEFRRKLADSAQELHDILGDGKEEDQRRTLLNTLVTCEYFESLMQNSASKKEKKDKKKCERSEEERKNKSDDPNRPKSPPVTFLSSPDLPTPSTVPTTFFGYDDSLPHPNQIFYHAAGFPPGLQQFPQLQQHPLIMGPPPHLAHMAMPQLQPMQLHQVATFAPNGQSGSWEASSAAGAAPAAAAGGGVKSSPSGSSKEGSGSVTPNERNGKPPRTFEPRRPQFFNNNMNPFMAPMNHPPFGLPFFHPLQFTPPPGNGMMRAMPHHHNQRFPLNGIANGMGSLGLNGGLPLGMQNPGLFIPPTTSINSNGQPFRRPPPRYSNGHSQNGAIQNGTPMN